MKKAPVFLCFHIITITIIIVSICSSSVSLFFGVFCSNNSVFQDTYFKTLASGISNAFLIIHMRGDKKSMDFPHYFIMT